MVLSVIIISHNQKNQLKRCIDSILAQDLPFEHEIIISDDASNDGSWELAQQFSQDYKNVKSVQCNTDDCNPATRSERSGWNRCNGLKVATGKYLAHVDGDDFFINGTTVYKKQVELLEMHPDCSCCMANDYNLKDGEDLSLIKLRHAERFKTGQIISSELYIKSFFRESHCFVYRRQSGVNPIELYGGYYVDTLLTDHYVQFGDIVCLDDAGYVYVQYSSSIWSISLRNNDSFVVNPVIYIPILIPRWKYSFISSRGRLVSLLRAVFMSLSNYKLEENNVKWISSFDVFIYKSFNRHLLRDKIRLCLLCFILICLILITPKNNHPLFKIMYKLLW